MARPLSGGTAGPVLVTGAGGMIGRSVVAALRAAGVAVIAAYRTGVPAGAVDADWVSLDLTAGDAPARLRQWAPGAVVHCAAVIPQRATGPEAEAAQRANRQMDDAVARACRDGGARLVYLSSASVYGLSAARLDEDAPLHPLGPYSQSKLAGERAVQGRVADHAILRVSAPYGAGQPTRTVLSLFVDRALAGEPLRYHGTGARCQDFIAVEDVAAAAARAAGHPACGVFNVATGVPISMVDLAALVVTATGSSSPVGPSGEPDPQEHHRARFDVRRIRDAMAWEAGIALEDGVRRYAAARRDG